MKLVLVAAEDFPGKIFVKKDTKRMETYSLYAIYSAVTLEMSGINTEREFWSFGMISSGTAV
ncbi:MAG: hypothetical protein ACLTW7_16060 [Enterococcus sp.]|uniref:hypothetical protein n=1 Tax=Enterococcus sp. TaxID=35783 RepID=UPI0039918C21